MGIIARSGDGPPVVLLSQLDIGVDSWKIIIDRLPGNAIFGYDRPGCGDAPPRPAPNPALPYSVFAEELAVLLESHRVGEPAVLVGHSIGAPIAKLFAHRYPGRVAGVVFLDGSIPQNLTWPRTEWPVDGEGPGATTFDVVAGHVEVLRAEPLAVPAAVLTRRRHWWLPDFDAIPHPANDDLWFVSQQILARQWHAPLVIADAGHQIPREAPDLVAYAIGAVVRAARDGGATALDPSTVSELGGTLVDG